MDIRHTLPFGNEDEIEEDVRNTIRTSGSGVGLVRGPQHAVQPDVPVENVGIMTKATGGLGKHSIE